MLLKLICHGKQKFKKCVNRRHRKKTALEQLGRSFNILGYLTLTTKTGRQRQIHYNPNWQYLKEKAKETLQSANASMAVASQMWSQFLGT